MPLSSAPRPNLVGTVISQLEALIESGEWAVGSKIPPEPVLVEQLGVGRNTVREAVRALVHTGLLEPRQGDGTYVRSRSELAAAMQRRLRRSATLDAYEVRASLERDAARYAALRRTDDDLAALRAALGGRTRAWQAQDTEALIEADVTFHQKVAAAAHNPVLAELYDYFSDALRSTLSSVMRAPLPDAVRLQNAAHVTIVDAIAARDPDAAEQAAVAHLTEASQALRGLADADTPPHP
ncbi:FadR/GntR family transcriptional regulator [Streptomyces albus]|uniref:FadR/GntR family transcriptional regulator n=1 Tax=Streptomyces albus TaxID=1888 RepID=UPI0024ADC7CA|nr:FadR/GntR family transcriptional regulator [Streptomyces albus]MDI6412592.1 FadR/GntR family transcriptional regulator [Streptomyces albus]